jgi:CDP-diacylglycerol--serine O-phosphatidyltransferase
MYSSVAEQKRGVIALALQMPIDPNTPEMRGRRFRPIPVRLLVPNVITLLAICAGLTAIRLSTEGRMELAVAAMCSPPCSISLTAVSPA